MTARRVVDATPEEHVVETLRREDALERVRDPPVHEEVDVDRRVVLGDRGLARDLGQGLAEVHLDRPVDDRDQEAQAGLPDHLLVRLAEPEHDHALVLLHHAHGEVEDHEHDRQQEREEREGDDEFHGVLRDSGPVRGRRGRRGVDRWGGGGWAGWAGRVGGVERLHDRRETVEADEPHGRGAREQALVRRPGGPGLAGELDGAERSQRRLHDARRADRDRGAQLTPRRLHPAAPRGHDGEAQHRQRQPADGDDQDDGADMDRLGPGRDGRVVEQRGTDRDRGDADRAPGGRGS